MLTIGLIILEDDIRVDQSTIANGWKAIELPSPARGLSQLKARLKKTEAVAIVGADARKTRYARKALALGKHVLIDFPAGRTWNEVAHLKELSANNGLCFCSPNLLTLETGMSELRQMAGDGSSKLLSLTVSYGIGGRPNQTQYSMKLAQLLDLTEWVVGSKHVNARQERSGTASSVNARVVLLSHENGVKTMLNIHYAPSRNPSLWIDGVFENSMVYLNPWAQTIKLQFLSDHSQKEISWAVSSLRRAIEDFEMAIDKRSEPSDFDDQSRVIELTRKLTQVG
jgi:predicted dehydrogenase